MITISASPQRFSRDILTMVGKPLGGAGFGLGLKVNCWLGDINSYRPILKGEVLRDFMKILVLHPRRLPPKILLLLASINTLTINKNSAFFVGILISELIHDCIIIRSVQVLH